MPALCKDLYLEARGRPVDLGLDGKMALVTGALTSMDGAPRKAVMDI
jgi:hypothetical protein